MATQTSVIYGINTRGGLGEVLNYDKALLNLGLDPEDLSLLGRIASSSTGITRDDFYTLSGSTENLFPKISGRVQAARDIVHEAEKTAGAFRTSLTVNQNSTGVSGNVIVNGPIAAPTIRFFSTELLNAAGTDFEPLDISTSRVSSWSRSGNNISYGASLLIDSLGDGQNYNGGADTSNSPSLGVGSIVIDENEGLTQITPREFTAEQATHKLKVRINGKTYFMYAMKNIPLRFTGNFIGRTSGPIASITATTAPDYRVIIGDDSITQTGNSDLTFRSTAEGIKTIEAYVNPATITELEMTGLNLENFPRADYTTLETLNFSGNKISTFPNFKSIAPNLKTLDFSNNPLNNSPEGSDPKINKLSQELLNRIPNGDCPTDEAGVTNLDLSGCFSGEVTGNFRTTFPNLQVLDISGTTGKVLNSPTLPEVGTRVVTYTLSNNYFSSVPGLAPIKVFHDTPASGLDFDGTGSNHGGAKLTLRRLKDRFEVEINSPGGATVYDAYGDGITRNYIQGNVLNGVTGAGSPEGIPFGNLIVQTSGGVVTAANFSPVGAAGPLADTGPTHTEVLKAGRAFSLANDYDTPFRSVGYYTDAGLLSSPMSITSLTIAGSADLQAINDRNHAWMNLPLTPAHKSYNEDITNVNFDGTEGAGIPFFTPGYTKLKTFNANNMDPARASEVNANLNKVVGAGKFTPATSDSLTEMMQLYDSPTGTYKFSGCTNLETLNLINTRLVGKLPKFEGNDKLKTIHIHNSHFYQHAESTASKPFALPHDQFTDAALDTVETFQLQKSYGFFNIAAFGGYDLNTLTGPARQIFAPGSVYTRYEQAPFETVNVDGVELTAFDKLKRVRSIRWFNWGTSGPLPTFKNNESRLYWLYLGHNRFGKDFDGTGTDWGGTVSGGLFNEWRVPSIRTSLRYFYFHANHLKGTINFQNMANADSTTQDDMSRIESLQGDSNQLKKIDNWGHTSLPRLDRLYLRNTFRDSSSDSDNYYGFNKENGHLIPSFAGKLPRIERVYLSEAVKGAGPFKGFADASTDNIFEGCARLKVLDLSGNKFDKSAVLEVLRSLKNQNLRNVTVNFKKQKDSDSDGDLDFRNDPLADNDLIQSCKEQPFRFTVSGVKNKDVPPAPAAPTTFTHAYTSFGFSSRVTGNTANLGLINGVAWGAAADIEGRLTLSGFATGTDKIIVTKVQSAVTGGATVSVSTITSDIFGTITINDTITTAGRNTDINTEDSSWVEGAVQSIEYIVQAEGERGLGNPKSIQLNFSNVTVE